MNNPNTPATQDLEARLVDQGPDATIFADRAGVIRLWNQAAIRVFGYEPGEALGKSLDIIIPERFRPAHWKGFARALQDRRTQYEGRALPTRAVRADGSPLYVELSFAMVTDAQGEVLGALAQARDITERFGRERADRERLLALEKTVACLRRAGA